MLAPTYIHDNLFVSPLACDFGSGAMESGSGRPSHPPLRRVSHGPRVSVTCEDQPRPFDVSFVHKSLTDCGSGEPQQDSCYSSCSDSDHSSVSREASETLAQECHHPQGSPTSSLANQVGHLLLSESPQYHHLRDFTLRLGYKESQLQSVLLKLGVYPLPGQDKILAELIKLGKEERREWTPAYGAAQLRPIVIDGSNIAMTHGRKEVFSCLGIKHCVDFFRNRGHTSIQVFVPQFRRETPRADCPITDQHILLELEDEGLLIWTPSRRVGGRRIVCHDDRYILKTAAEKDAVVVSNDEYRDLIKEAPAFRRLVEERLLMYSFVDGKFMPPDDPLGKHGPKLDQFLSRGGAGATAALCPYGRKCTYGNKCKYFHPERPGGVHMTVTERLLSRKPLAATTSLAYEPSAIDGARASKQNAARTQSLNLPVSISVADHSRRMCVDDQPSPLSLPPPDPAPHQTLNRNLSAPGHGRAARCRFEERKNSVSDTQLNWTLDRALWRTASTDSAFGSEGSAPQSNFYIPSQAVWGPMEFSVGPVSPSQPTPPSADNDRTKLYYHLSQLFPESVVLAVMTAHPHESDPQLLCSRILAMQRGFGPPS